MNELQEILRETREILGTIIGTFTSTLGSVGRHLQGIIKNLTTLMLCLTAVIFYIAVVGLIFIGVPFMLWTWVIGVYNG